MWKKSPNACYLKKYVKEIKGEVEIEAGPAQGLGKLGLGLRPHKNKKFFLRKKAPLFIVKGPNFYKIIYIF